MFPQPVLNESTNCAKKSSFTILYGEAGRIRTWHLYVAPLQHGLHLSQCFTQIHSRLNASSQPLLPK